MQPSTYGIDNRCLVDALGQLGSASRGVAVVDTDVKDAELRTLTDAGVRAIRVNFVSAQTWGTTTAGDADHAREAREPIRLARADPDDG